MFVNNLHRHIRCNERRTDCCMAIYERQYYKFTFIIPLTISKWKCLFAAEISLRFPYKLKWKILLYVRHLSKLSCEMLYFNEN